MSEWLSWPEHRFLASFLTPSVLKLGSTWAQGSAVQPLDHSVKVLPPSFLTLMQTTLTLPVSHFGVLSNSLLGESVLLQKGKDHSHSFYRGEN